MDKRRRIGLVFSYNENWIAGAYYILNIIHAINRLEDKLKPNITILSDALDNFNIVKDETNYKYLDFAQYPFKEVEYTSLEKFINKIGNVLFGKKIFNKRNNVPKLDFVYPRSLYLISKNLKTINWIPDFQEDYLPHFFSDEEVARRKEFQKNVVANGDIVVLSSNDARQDFTRLYPKAKAVPFVLNFAVSHPDFSNENINVLKDKYNLVDDYFFAPNQFWAHKNHIVILRAVKHLKDKGINVVVAMSGKENDYRNEDNFKKLQRFVEENNLKNNIKFLGFLPRTEQLCLFKNAIAVIQPSLFEGWSTVVEDSKKLNKLMILSNLKVHKEQVSENAYFFNPEDDIDLAAKIEKVFKEKPSPKPLDYNRNIEKFGSDFLNLVETATKP